MAQAPIPKVKGEVLIVEDSLASLTLLSDIMTDGGYTVRQAQDGEIALLSVKNRAPDLILLDVRMPGMDGYEVCKQLKADKKLADIPIIFLSALQDTEAKLQGFRLGAVDYIEKPYQPEEVLMRVRTHMELRNLQLHLTEMCELRTLQLSQEVEERRQAQLELSDSRQKLRELTGYLLDVREEERTRIAREIHDELGQSLTVARIDLTRLEARLDEPKGELQQTIRSIIAVLEQTADTARSISNNLRPGMLDLLGLGAAIESHVNHFSEATGIHCQLNIDVHQEFDVHPRVATAAFRILQESLTNVARHARASKVDIQIAELGDELIVIVQDNGKGMAGHKLGSKPHSYGLLGMSERAQLLGGNLLLESSPGKGTRIEASLPRHMEQPA